MFVCLTDYLNKINYDNYKGEQLVCSKCKRVFVVPNSKYSNMCIYKCRYDNCDGVGLTEEDFRKGIIDYEPIFINEIKEGLCRNA